MGEALLGAAGDGGHGRGAAAKRLSPAPAGMRAVGMRAAARRLARLLATLVVLALAMALPGTATLVAQRSEAPTSPEGDSASIRLDAGRFTVVAHARDAVLARSLLEAAGANDTFPGLPRPRARAIIAVAPDEGTFRRWVGPRAPEWGVAVAFPGSGRIVVRGRGAGAARESPLTVLRHELAHLALHEAMGDLPPRWFDEGYASYAAGEWGRDEVLATNVALLFRRVPPLDTLERMLTGRAGEAQGAYALSHRAVAELAALDPERGLANLFRYWRETARLDPAVRRAYGTTLDAFEERWQRRTRLRYGFLALVGDLGIAMLFLLAVTTPLVVARRRRDCRRMEELRAADRRADAEVAALVIAFAAAMQVDRAAAGDGDDDAPAEAATGRGSTQA
ncbi:MAG TPA: hypothetical protein VGE02_10320 [Gemmatimonadales bacterium]